MASDKRALREGMREGDLRDLVLPLISVDEYESKVDDEAVVFGFYVEDSGAADDFNRFVQKSPVTILDTEVSPAPDQHGYYLCFVELLDNKRLAANVHAILDEIGPLAGLDEWQMRVRKADKVVAFSEETLTKLLSKARHGEKAEVLEFLQPSDLLSASLHEGTLTLCGTGGCQSFEITGFGTAENVLDARGLTESAINLGLQSVAYCGRLGGLLGEGWSVSLIGHNVLLQRADTTQSLLLVSTTVPSHDVSNHTNRR